MSNEFFVKLGKRVAKMRKEMGYTQEEFAELASTSKQTVSQIELGRQDLKATTAMSIAKAFGVSTDYLLTGKYSDIDLLFLDKAILDLDEDKINFVKNTVNDFLSLCKKSDLNK